jgi:monoamine oxidase
MRDLKKVWRRFVGEHTDVTGHRGTVHGALRSGLRAARQVLHH